MCIPASCQPARRSTSLDLAANGLVLGALWFAYRSVRSLTAGTQGVAIANATRLLEVQTNLGIAVEAELQALADVAPMMVAANTYYLAHFPLAVGVLAISYIQDRRGTFVMLRNSLLGVTAVAVIIHAMVPLAPPRMLTGFVDISLLYGPDPYSLPGSNAANQFAAMPSMHVAWALLAAAAVWRLAANSKRRRVIRVAAFLHPIVTAFVVLVTAHHFAADVVVGAALAAVALVAPWLIMTARRSERQAMAVHVKVAP